MNNFNLLGKEGFQEKFSQRKIEKKSNYDTNSLKNDINMKNTFSIKSLLIKVIIMLLICFLIFFIYDFFLIDVEILENNIIIDEN